MRMKKRKSMDQCKRPDLKPSTASLKYHCQCHRCVLWRRDTYNVAARQYRLLHRERVNEYYRRYHRTGKGRASDKRWKRNHPDRIRVRNQLYAQKHPDKMLSFGLKQYGLTVEQYHALGNVCMICGCTRGEKRRLDVDHDAVTGIVRGLLCGKCNKGIGLLNHDSRLLQNAILYLEDWDGGNR